MVYNFRGRPRARGVPFRGRGRGGRGRGFDRAEGLVITLNNRGQGQNQAAASWVPLEDSPGDGSSEIAKPTKPDYKGVIPGDGSPSNEDYTASSAKKRVPDDGFEDSSPSRTSRDKFDLKAEAESLRITVGNEMAHKDREDDDSARKNSPLSNRLGPPVNERKDKYRDRNMDDRDREKGRSDNRDNYERDGQRSREREGDRGSHDGRYRERESDRNRQDRRDDRRDDYRGDRNHDGRSDRKDDVRRDNRDDYRDDRRNGNKGDYRDDRRDSRRDSGHSDGRNDYRDKPRRDDFRDDRRGDRDDRRGDRDDRRGDRDDRRGDRDDQRGDHRDDPRGDHRDDPRGDRFDPRERGHHDEGLRQIGSDLHRQSSGDSWRSEQEKPSYRRDDPFGLASLIAGSRTSRERSIDDRDRDMRRIPSPNRLSVPPRDVPSTSDVDRYGFPGSRPVVEMGSGERLHEPPAVLPPAPKPLKSILKRKAEPSAESAPSIQSVQGGSQDFSTPSTTAGNMSYENQVEDFLKRLQLPGSRPSAAVAPTFPVMPVIPAVQHEFGQTLNLPGSGHSETSQTPLIIPGFESIDHGHAPVKVPGLGHPVMNVDDEEQFLYGEAGSGSMPPRESLFPIMKDSSKPKPKPASPPPVPASATQSDLPSWMNPQTEPQVPVEEPKDDMDKTIQNVLKSIGFNFDLSKRMQELAKVKKKKEHDSRFSINKNASFLGGGIAGSDIKEKLFQKEKRLEMKERIMQSAKSHASRESSAMQFVNQEPASRPENYPPQREQPRDYRDSRRDSRERSPHDSRERSPHDSRGRDSYRSEAPTMPTQIQQAQFYATQPPPGYGNTATADHPGKPPYYPGIQKGAGQPHYSEGHRPSISPDRPTRKPSRFRGGANRGMVSYSTESDDDHDESEGRRIATHPVKRVREKSPEYSRIVLAPKSKKRESSPTTKLSKQSEHPKRRRSRSPMKTDIKISVTADKKEVFVDDSWEQLPLNSDPAIRDKWKAVPGKEKGLSKDYSVKVEKAVLKHADPLPKVPIVQLTAAERQTLLKESEERKRKLQLLERELGKLKKHQNEIMRKRRRQRDGDKDPLLVQNSKLQDEISAQIKLLRKVSDESDFALKHSEGRDAIGSGSPPTDSEEPVKTTGLLKRHEFYDPGSHWCSVCNHMSLSLIEHLTHLQSKKHKQKRSLYERPWLDEVLKNETPVDKSIPVGLEAIKGVEFMMSADAYYCSLCCVFSGDVTCAEKHLKSEDHFAKYQNHLKQNEFYEKRYTLEKTAFLSQMREEEYEQKKRSAIDKKSAEDVKHETSSSKHDSARGESPLRRSSRSRDDVESDRRRDDVERDRRRDDVERDRRRDDVESDRSERRHGCMSRSEDEDRSSKTERRESAKRDHDEDDSQQDDGAKGRIAIKLTGRSLIKPQSKPLPPWTPLTKTIHTVKPKPSPDVPKKVATITKQDIDQPSSLGKFLSIGGLTTKKLPVYKLRPGTVKKLANPSNKMKPDVVDDVIDYKDMKMIGIEQDTTPIGPKPPPPPEISLNDIPMPPSPHPPPEPLPRGLSTPEPLPPGTIPPEPKPLAHPPPLPRPKPSEPKTGPAASANIDIFAAESDSKTSEKISAPDSADADAPAKLLPSGTELASSSEAAGAKGSSPTATETSASPDIDTSVQDQTAVSSDQQEEVEKQASGIGADPEAVAKDRNTECETESKPVGASADVEDSLRTDGESLKVDDFSAVACEAEKESVGEKMDEKEMDDSIVEKVDNNTSSTVAKESLNEEKDDTSTVEKVDNTSSTVVKESLNEDMDATSSIVEKGNLNEKVDNNTSSTVAKESLNEEKGDTSTVEKGHLNEKVDNTSSIVAKESLNEEMDDTSGIVEKGNLNEEMDNTSSTVDKVESEEESDVQALYDADTDNSDAESDKQMENSEPADTEGTTAIGLDTDAQDTDAQDTVQEYAVSEDMDTSSTEKEMSQAAESDIQNNDEISSCGNLDVVLSTVCEDSVDKNGDVVAFDMLMPSVVPDVENSMSAMSEMDDLSGNISFMMGEIISMEGDENANASADCNMDFSGGSPSEEVNKEAQGHTDGASEGSGVSLSDFQVLDEVS